MRGGLWGSALNLDMGPLSVIRQGLTAGPNQQAVVVLCSEYTALPETRSLFLGNGPIVPLIYPWSELKNLEQIQTSAL